MLMSISVADLYLDFVCLEEGLFSLAQAHVYIMLGRTPYPDDRARPERLRRVLGL
jgi:hypothetical protein